jgi:uncharacterized OB-fold protein
MSEPVMGFGAPIRLEYNYTPGLASSRYLRSIAQRRIVGQRCPSCKKVYVPPRGTCPTCAVPTEEEVELAHKGTITTFCIVNLPFYKEIEPPYVAASILLDGADIALFHLIQEVPEGRDVTMGMRVEAVWVDDADLAPTLESIKYFRPIDEPDAPYDSYKDQL